MRTRRRALREGTPEERASWRLLQSKEDEGLGCRSPAAAPLAGERRPGLPAGRARRHGGHPWRPNPLISGQPGDCQARARHRGSGCQSARRAGARSGLRTCPSCGFTCARRPPFNPQDLWPLPYAAHLLRTRSPTRITPSLLPLLCPPPTTHTHTAVRCGGRGANSGLKGKERRRHATPW